MSADILTALIAAAGSMAGAVCGALASRRLTAYRVDQLEKKLGALDGHVKGQHIEILGEKLDALDEHVKQHNNFMERVARLEVWNSDQDRRIDDLESLHKRT